MMRRKRPAPRNEMKLSFPARSENERLARIAVSGFVSALDPTLEEMTDIKTAVSEAVTNAIVHGYRDSMGEVMMDCRMWADGLVAIRIRDKGCGIADVKKAMEPLFTTAPEDERAGLGFAIMETFMDRITVRSREGKGTTVVLYRTVRGKADGEA